MAIAIALTASLGAVAVAPSASAQTKVPPPNTVEATIAIGAEAVAVDPVRDALWLMNTSGVQEVSETSDHPLERRRPCLHSEHGGGGPHHGHRVRPR
jgi:hypothetical protein